MSSGGLVRRWLKVADPTAITARETLQRALGYGRKVAGVDRSEVFSFAWARGVGDARAALEQLVRGTNLLLNPNKHFAEVLLDQEPLRVRGNVWVLVWEAGAGRILVDTIARRRLLPFPLTAARQGVLWEIELEGDDGERAARAREIASARARNSGLLANPHYQEVLVMDTPPDARRVIDTLEATMAGGIHGGN